MKPLRLIFLGCAFLVPTLLALRISSEPEHLSRLHLNEGAEAFRFGKEVESAMDSQELVTLKNALHAAKVDVADFHATDLQLGWDPPGVKLHLHPRYKTMWFIAATENNITGKTASAFAKRTVKYPKSWVKRILNLTEENKEKSYNLTFAGSLTGHSNPGGRRDWVLKFFEKFGRPNDVFKDNSQHESNYASKGPWDRTGKEGRGLQPSHKGQFTASGHWRPPEFHMDELYWKEMSQSSFTLSPGGMQPWGQRYWEAAAVKSIPIINDPKEDIDYSCTGTRGCWGIFVPEIGFEHRLAKDYPFEYNATMAESNFNKWYKYMTFETGDHTPESANI